MFSLTHAMISGYQTNPGDFPNDAHRRRQRRFGFIKSGNEEFWFSPDYLFSSTMVPVEDVKVVFTPLPALPNAKNRRASSIFVEGTKLQGQINRVLKGRGCAFATINSQGGESHSLFLETGEDPAIVVGATVEFITGENKGGPMGTRVKVVSAGTS